MPSAAAYWLTETAIEYRSVAPRTYTGRRGRSHAQFMRAMAERHASLTSRLHALDDGLDALERLAAERSAEAERPPAPLTAGLAADDLTLLACHRATKQEEACAEAACSICLCEAEEGALKYPATGAAM